MPCDTIRLTLADDQLVEFKSLPDGTVQYVGRGSPVPVKEVRLIKEQNRLVFPGASCLPVCLKDDTPLSDLSTLLDKKNVVHNFKTTATKDASFDVGDMVLANSRPFRIVKYMKPWNRYQLEDGAGVSVWRDGRALKALPRIVLTWDERMNLHGAGDTRALLEAPERTERCEKVWDMLVETKLVEKCTVVKVQPASKADICIVHTERHYEQVMGRRTECLKDENNSAKTLLTEGSPLAARLAVGCTITAMRQVCDNQAPAAMALVRPPGHHALPEASMGFCLFNNVAIAARVAKRDYGLKRILILDWDVHHGNGIQDVFYADREVLYISLHVRAGGNFYPGTGGISETGVRGGEGFNVNVAWRDTGVGDAEYKAAFQSVVMPIAQEFDPELVFVSAGFDAAEGDPLGDCNVTPECFRWMTQQLLTLADGKLVAALEGGYSTSVLAKCTVSVVTSLMQDSFSRGVPPCLSPLSPQSQGSACGASHKSLPMSPGFDASAKSVSAFSATEGRLPDLSAYNCPTSSWAALVDTARVMAKHWPCLEPHLENLQAAEAAARAVEQAEMMKARTRMYES